MYKYLQRLWCAVLNKKCEVCKCKEETVSKPRGRPKKSK